MYEKTKNHSCVSYEYKSVTVSSNMKSVYLDGYANFGWEFYGTEPAPQGSIAIVLRFRRDRRLKNKLELCRLERELENSLHEIEKLEKIKDAKTMAFSIGFGILGAAFLIGSASSFFAGNILLCIVLLIPAAISGVIGYVSSSSMKRKQDEKIAPQIDNYYDSVHKTCEKANTLLSGSFV